MDLTYKKLMSTTDIEIKYPLYYESLLLFQITFTHNLNPQHKNWQS